MKELDKKHPSHSTRSSDASSYDEICVNCGATDVSGAGWGKLAMPCKTHIEHEDLDYLEDLVNKAENSGCASMMQPLSVFQKLITEIKSLRNEIERQKPFRYLICDSRFNSEDLADLPPTDFDACITVIPLFCGRTN